MDEQLSRWASRWKALEIPDLNVLQRAQSAHRREAAVHTLLTVAWSLGVAVVAALSVGGPYLDLPVRPFRLAFAIAALLLGAGALAITRLQIARARALLTATPVGVVQDLIRLHERELQQWVSPWSFGVTCALAVSAIAWPVVDLVAAARANASALRAIGALAFAITALSALVIVGLRRVRVLRLELARLHALARELEG